MAARQKFPLNFQVYILQDFANKKSTVLVAYRLEQLEKKQDVHNQVIDRVYELEKSVALNSEDIKVANHRIEDLEKK